MIWLRPMKQFVGELIITYFAENKHSTVSINVTTSLTSNRRFPLKQDNNLHNMRKLKPYVHVELGREKHFSFYIFVFGIFLEFLFVLR